MGNQIRIDGDEASATAAEMAGLTGESVDAAVVEPLRLRLEQERRARDKAAKVERVLTLASKIHTQLARQAWRDFGGGKHAADLNSGGFLTYGSAKAEYKPLLFKSKDLSPTDVEPALQP